MYIPHAQCVVQCFKNKFFCVWQWVGHGPEMALSLEDRLDSPTPIINSHLLTKPLPSPKLTLFHLLHSRLCSKQKSPPALAVDDVTLSPKRGRHFWTAPCCVWKSSGTCFLSNFSGDFFVTTSQDDIGHNGIEFLSRASSGF